MTTLIKQQPKLSVRKPGYWRNKYWFAEDYFTGPNKTSQGPGTVIGETLCATEAEARRVAEEFMHGEWYDEDDFPCEPGCIVYLGPVFFPEEGDGQ